MPFPFQCCCVAKSGRSDVYIAAPDAQPTTAASKADTNDNGTTTIPAAPAPPKYSWDLRRSEAVDMSRFRVSDIDGDFVKRDDINGQQLTIDNCKRAVIAVLDVTGSVVIDDCVDCTFVVGPCNGSLFIRNSTNCRLFYVGQQFRLRDCRDMDIAIHCRTQPIIESASTIRFYPLNLNYPGLYDQLILVGLSAFGVGTRNVHDYTPTPGSRNYQLCNDELRMDLASVRELRRAAGISLDFVDSIFIQRHDVARNEPRVLVMAVQRSFERHADFYRACYDAAKAAQQSGFADVAEGTIDEELGDALKDDFAAGLGSRVIVLDVAGDTKEVSGLVDASSDPPKPFRRVPTRYANQLRERFFG